MITIIMPKHMQGDFMNKLKQRTFAAASTTALLIAGAMISAQPAFSANYGPQYAPHNPSPNLNDPATKVSAQLNALRAFLAESQGGAIDPDQTMGFIEQQITPDIDFATMTRMSLGRLASRMTPQQQQTAQSVLRRNFATKLVDAMGDIRATRVTVGKTRRGTSRGELVVPVRLDRWRGQPLSIRFRFYQTKQGWKIFDAEANGQSAVLFYRGYFARQWRGG